MVSSTKFFQRDSHFYFLFAHGRVRKTWGFGEMIIDCLCHAGKGDGLTGPWDTNAPLRDFLRWSAAAGIARTVLFAAFHSDYAHANRLVARIVARKPARFFGFAFIHPLRDAGRVAAMVREAVVE